MVEIKFSIETNENNLQVIKQFYLDFNPFPSKT